MSPNNAVITGMGVISAAGENINQTLVNFKSGIQSPSKVTLFKTNLTCPVFEVKPELKINNKTQMRTLALCFHAVREALENADILDDLKNLRVGVCMGTTVASQLNDIDFYSVYRKESRAGMDSVDRFLKGNLAEAIAREYKLNGPVCTVVNACSSGTDAVGVALSWLNNDECDVAIAGGADELNLIPLSGFNSLSVVSDSVCAPFDRDRKGLNLGEGAGVMVMEKKSIAKNRGRKSNLCVCGYATNCDAYHLTAPRPDGASFEYSLLQVLRIAGIKHKDISFVNAHGTATRDNDKVEGNVLCRVFGENLKFLSTKGFTGHTLGAAGGLEAVFTVLGLEQSWIPANIGFMNKDDEIPIAPVREVTKITGQYALSSSLAFGGNNAVLIFAKN